VPAMRRWIANTASFFLIVGLVFSHRFSFAQPNEPEGARKVLTRVVPTYPELARRMNVWGIVKLEAVISPDGRVKSTEVIGGNPLLVQAAVDAVRKWRYQPTSQQTRERIELKFNSPLKP
jgi:TonB family protein